MRKSRVLLAGVAVAAAAAATSAFTAGNDLSAAGDSVLGYGEVNVTGATVTAIDYNVDPGDNSVLTDIVFHLSGTTPVTTRRKRPSKVRGESRRWLLAMKSS